MADDDESTSDSSSEGSSSSDSSSESEPAPEGESSSGSVEGSEPPPAGDDTEPAPAGESSSSDDPSDKPLEDNEGHSDSSAETDSGDSSSSESSSSSSSDSSSSSGSSSSSSDDSSSGAQAVQPPSEDDVAGALTKAFQDHNVPMDDDTVRVTLSDGLYQIGVRLSSSFNPLPKVPDDTSNLAPGSVQGALYMINGGVQIFGDQVRVTMRIVSVETSEILQSSKADASGSVLDGITGAAGDCLAGLPALNAT